MRDVRRYAASARGTIRALNGQVELADILGLEAIRVFTPDLFAGIIGAQEALTRPVADSRYEPPDRKRAVERFLQDASDNRDVAYAVVSRLFPAGLRHIENMHYGAEWLKEWLKARRVAHPDVLKLYLERIANEGMLAFSDAERAFALLGDEEAFHNFFQAIDADRREDVIAALESFEGDYPAEAVTPGVVVLLNLIGTLPARSRGFFALDTRLVVARVVLRMLRQAGSSSDVARVVDDALTRIAPLSSRFELIRTVGHREGSGSHLVDETFAAQKEDELFHAIENASPETLANEWDLLHLLSFAHERDAERILARDYLDDPTFSANLLLQARSESQRRSMSSRAVAREAHLSWDLLMRLCGSAEDLRRAVDAARSIAPRDARIAEVVELADRYASGWRPKEF
jgi:hypothetical protein